MRLRPTTDAGKETLFNVLENYFLFEDLSVLDLFSGTGSIAYEFCSRGAINVMAVDNNYHSVKFIKNNAIDFKMDGLKTIKMDAFQFLKKSNNAFDIIFADPPYDHKDIYLIPDLVLNNRLLKNKGWFILEHGPKIDVSKLLGFSEKRKIGNVNFSIFRP